MRVAILAVLLLAACASDSAYERGTPARPAPAFRPHEDAPHTTGQPGHVERPSLPRSDNRRPSQYGPSGGPALMAADGDDERAIRLMFTQDAPATPEGLSPGAHRRCWADTRGLLRKDPRVLRLSHAEAKCLRTLIYAHCGARMIEHASHRAKYPEEPMKTPRGRTVGTYNQRDFDEALSGRRNQKACGNNHEFWTDRVSDIMRGAVEHGDDVLGWNP